MESLESCVQTLDMRSMPQFLDQVSESRENEASRHFAISLYAELARVHKQAVIPFIPRMMASIVRSLPFSADSQQLHEACAKVITSVARHTIDPTRSYDSNQEILFKLCSPLLPVLSSKLESSAAGAAICLQALVESEKWKFAHIDLQDLVCTKATAALVEQGTHTVAFLHLLKSLIKFCVDASQKHVAEWLGIGLQALQADSVLWQRRLAAAQLITIILRTADAEKLGVDLPHVMKMLELCLLDKVTVVQTAVTEAFQTAKGLALEKHLLCARRFENLMTQGKTGSVDLSGESRGQVSDAEGSSTQDLSNSVSPRSGASSHEAVPSIASSRGSPGVERKLSKQREKNASYSSHLSGSLTRRSVLKENTPATMPRRVLSEIPALGKRFSNSDFLPSSWEGKSLRRASGDLGIKEASYSMQKQAPLGSKKYPHVLAPIHDSAKRTASLKKKHVDGCQIISFTECTCVADLRTNENVSHWNEAAGQNNIISQNSKTLEELDQRVKESDEFPPGGSVPMGECLHGDTRASKSDGDAGDEDAGPSSEDTSMKTGSKDFSSAEEGSPLKVASLCKPSRDFNFRAPGSLLHSLQGENPAKDTGQICKDCSDCENRARRAASCTASDSFASGDSEEDRMVLVSSQSRNAASNSRSEESETSTNRKYKLNSCTDRHSIQSTSESASRPSFVPANDSEVSASGRDWASSRDSSDREADHNVKLGHSHASSNLQIFSKENGSQRSQAKGRPELLTKASIRLGEGQHTDIAGHSVIRKKQVCAGVGLGLFCAVGMLILAFMVIKPPGRSYGLHVLVPT